MRFVPANLYHLALCALLFSLIVPGKISAEEVNAGPIWNDADAQRKCPSVCGGRKWDGAWHTTNPGSMSVCNCSGKKNSNAYSSSSSRSKTSFTFNVSSPPPGQSNDLLSALLGVADPGAWPSPGASSCSVGKTKHCPGCSISCTNGKQASCEPGKEWGPPNSSCMFSAKCRCN